MDNNKRFWLVWNEKKKPDNRPMVKHNNYIDAEKEAIRLAKSNRGEEFHILKVVRSCCVGDITWKHYGENDKKKPSHPDLEKLEKWIADCEEKMNG